MLLSAALLKLEPLLGSLQQPSVHLDLLTLAIPFCELALGIWLLSGKTPAIACCTALAFFFLFAVVNLWKVIHGYETCGCFGRWELSPTISYGIDAIAITCGLLSISNGVFDSSRIMIAAVLAVMLVLLGVVASMTKYFSNNPLHWVGREWPTPQDIDISADLTRGRWVVMLYHSSCQRCRGAVEDLAEHAQHWRSQGKAFHVALIDTGPGLENEDLKITKEIKTGFSLKPQDYGFPPIVLILTDGRIQAVFENYGGLDWDSPPISAWLK